MKLRNKKTGEIIETDFELSISIPDDKKLYGNNTYTQIKGYSSIKELSEDWADYEEPKEYCYLSGRGEVRCIEDENTDFDKDHKEIGNYFETKEEAEKAVEKLKAWKRLKDKGFKFCGHDDRDRGQLGDIVIYAEMPTFEYDDDSTRDDIDLLFGGEE